MPLLLALLVSTVHAEGEEKPPVDKPAEFNYVLGLRVNNGPDYMGSSTRSTGVRPVMALYFGRFRLSNSGASAVMGFGREQESSGASIDLVDRKRLSLGGSLRIDSGRSSSDSPRLAGLPDVKRTLRAQLSARYHLAEGLDLGLTWNTDLLGEGGGAIASLGIAKRLYKDGGTEWTAGGGVSWGNATNQRAYFGVTPAAALTSGYRIYEPGSGLRDAYVGTGWTRAINHHWIAFGALSYSQLQGPSADSPLVQQRGALIGSIGLAYRSR
ncbi:MAG TPA: MipA/OmpV family protein [Burkholderiaceae bacterium]